MSKELLLESEENKIKKEESQKKKIEDIINEEKGKLGEENIKQYNPKIPNEQADKNIIQDLSPVSTFKNNANIFKEEIEDTAKIILEKYFDLRDKNKNFKESLNNTYKEIYRKWDCFSCCCEYCFFCCKKKANKGQIK